MELIVICSVLAATLLFVIPLVVLRAGIRGQERMCSLTHQPAGFSAGLARRVLGLYASKPIKDDHPGRGPAISQGWHV